MSKKVKVFDVKGKDVGEVSVKDEMLRFEADASVLHQAVRYELALERQGTTSTKGRSEVRGGGAKPWRQKGTGRARAGSIRSPIWKGGGVVFGPTPRDHAIQMPKKMKALALKVALSEKIKQEQVKVVNEFSWTSPSTKNAVEAIHLLGAEGKVLVITTGESETVEKSLRNIPEVKIIHLDQVNTYDLLDSDNLICTKDVFERLLKERLS